MEYFFGILKSRFRFFRNGIKYSGQEVIDEKDVFEWERLDPEGEGEYDIDDVINFDAIDISPKKRFDKPVVTPTTIKGCNFVHSKKEHYHTLKEKLVIHLQRQYQIGDLHWPRNLNAAMRNEMPKAPPIERLLNGGQYMPPLEV